jgi:hypothetical protein
MSEKGQYFHPRSAFQSLPFSGAWNANFVKTNHKIMEEALNNVNTDDAYHLVAISGVLDITIWHLSSQS